MAETAIANPAQCCGATQQKESWGVKLPVHRRPDSRKDNFNLRPPVCMLQVLKSPHGSARFRMGHTSVLAAVYGPREASASDATRRLTYRSSSVGQGNVSVVLRPLAGPVNVMHKYIESSITEVVTQIIQVERLAYTTVTIILQPEADDGGLLSCCINATIGALLDAGIPMSSTCLSVSFVQTKETDADTGLPSILLDPTLEELSTPVYRSDLSAYYSCTVDIHTGSLLQLSPEFIPLTLQSDCGAQFPVVESLALPETGLLGGPQLLVSQWMPFLNTITAAGGACRILAETLRRAVEERLASLVTTTFTANNKMEIVSETEA